MFPEIWSATDRMFCHFGPFFALLLSNNTGNQNFEKMKKILGDFIISHKCTINDNHMMYDSWDMKCNTEFLVILGHFLPFHPTNHPKIQNFGKMKKILEDSIILDKCTKNNYYMLCCSWDVARNICNCYFSFWAIFCLFTSLAAWKIKIKKKHEKETPGDIIIYNSVPKIMIICYAFPEMWHITDVLIFDFGPFCALLPL